MILKIKIDDIFNELLLWIIFHNFEELSLEPMEQHFADLAVIRNHMVEYLYKYDLERLIYIPEGFRNHIFWNCAHALVTQQLMTYYLADVPMLVDNDWVMRFKKGTVGDETVSEKDVRRLIKLLQSTHVKLRKDYFDEELAYYRPYDTSFGIRLESVEDAIRFNNIHEALHLGTIQTMTKLLK